MAVNSTGAGQFPTLENFVSMAKQAKDNRLQLSEDGKLSVSKQRTGLSAKITKLALSISQMFGKNLSDRLGVPNANREYKAAKMFTELIAAKGYSAVKQNHIPSDTKVGYKIIDLSGNQISTIISKVDLASKYNRANNQEIVHPFIAEIGEDGELNETANKTLKDIKIDFAKIPPENRGAFVDFYNKYLTNVLANSSTRIEPKRVAQGINSVKEILRGTAADPVFLKDLNENMANNSRLMCGFIQNVNSNNHKAIAESLMKLSHNFLKFTSFDYPNHFTPEKFGTESKSDLIRTYSISAFNQIAASDEGTATLQKFAETLTDKKHNLQAVLHSALMIEKGLDEFKLFEPGKLTTWNDEISGLHNNLSSTRLAYEMLNPVDEHPVIGGKVPTFADNFADIMIGNLSVPPPPEGISETIRREVVEIIKQAIDRTAENFETTQAPLES